MKYGEDIKLTKSEKLLHAFKVLGEWKPARKQLHLGQIYDYEHGIHSGDKLWRKQHCSALNVYKRLGAKSGEILENILEWDGSFDEFSNEISERLPIFSSTNLDTIFKKGTDAVNQKLSCPKQALLHYGLLDQSELSDMAGIQD